MIEKDFEYYKQQQEDARESLFKGLMFALIMMGLLAAISAGLLFIISYQIKHHETTITA